MKTSILIVGIMLCCYGSANAASGNASTTKAGVGAGGGIGFQKGSSSPATSQGSSATAAAATTTTAVQTTSTTVTAVTTTTTDIPATPTPSEAATTITQTSKATTASLAASPATSTFKATTTAEETTTSAFPKTQTFVTTTSSIPTSPTSEETTIFVPMTKTSEETTTTTTYAPTVTTTFPSATTREVLFPSTTDCGEPRNITHGDVSYTNTTFGSHAFYSCDEKYILSGRSVIRCRSDGDWTNSTVTCVVDRKHIRCKESIDDRGTKWQETKPGEVLMKSCADHQKNLTGDLTRQCGEDGVWKLPKYNCVSQKFVEIENKVDELIKNKSTESVKEALDSLSTAISESGDSDKPLFGGELKKATTLLETIAVVSSDITVSKEQSQAFIDTASNLLDTKNQQSWEAVSDTDDEEEKKSAGAGKVLEVIDKFANAIANTLKNSKDTHRVVENKNMALQVAKLDTRKPEDIHFPDNKVKTIRTKSTIALKKVNLKGVTSYSAVVYKNLSGILPPESNNNSKTTQTINSVVLSLDLHGGSTTLKSNVTINLEHAKIGLVHPVCSFWNATLVAWDSRGCSLVSTSESLSVCQCSHLTNFAILMSPWTDSIVTRTLDVFSTVGCSISLAALIITVAMHVALWRYVKSDRTVVLMNLSVALVVSYIVFIAGVDRTENKDACTFVAVVLQYIYLVVFFLMLVEGIDLAIIVLYVFHTKSRTKWMIPLAWGVPVVIVGISLGATHLKGYGTDEFCWLSIEDGLIWGFVGPALCIMLVNIVLLTLILRAIFSAKLLSEKSRVAKVKMGVKSLCVLLPLIGSTWVLGMLYVNKDFAWVQYVFAVCNSLQGLVIFIFHCAFNPQMRVALQKRRKNYLVSRALKSDSTHKISMPRVSTTSLSHSDSDDRSYNRSISQESYNYQPDYPISGSHSFRSSRSSNRYIDYRF